MDPKELRGLYEAYSEVYAPQEVDESKHDSIASSGGGNRRARKSADMRKPYNDTMRRQDQLAMSKGKPFSDRVKKDSPMQYKSNEEVDIYDIVLSHLLDEGYADTIESAEAIMVNMSEEWKDEIIDEAYVDYRKGKLPSGRTPQQAAQGRRDALDAKIEAGSLTRKRPTPKDYDRASKQSSRTREMDSHTSFGGKVNKLLDPGGWNRGSASPRVAYGEPNTDRHQLARITRDAVSRASSAQRRSRGG